MADPNSGCWLWTGSLDGSGYGQIGTGLNKPKMARAHRASWELHKGQIPEGLCVLHKCDVPSCVNPDHLFLGTFADNTHDMMEKGRWRAGPLVPHYGTDHGRAKLTTEQVQHIRKKELLLREYAALYGIGTSQVWRVQRGEQWRLA